MRERGGCGCGCSVEALAAAVFGEELDEVVAEVGIEEAVDHGIDGRVDNVQVGDVEVDGELGVE